MRILLILAGLALSLAAASQEIYRWVDKNGLVHYSDQPDSPNAELITVIEPNAYEGEAATADGGASDSSGADPESRAVRFSVRIAVDRPADARRGVLRLGRDGFGRGRTPGHAAARSLGGVLPERQSPSSGRPRNGTHGPGARHAFPAREHPRPERQAGAQQPADHVPRAAGVYPESADAGAAAAPAPRPPRPTPKPAPSN